MPRAARTKDKGHGKSVHPKYEASLTCSLKKYYHGTFKKGLRMNTWKRMSSAFLYLTDITMSMLELVSVKKTGSVTNKM